MYLKYLFLTAFLCKGEGAKIHKDIFISLYKSISVYISQNYRLGKYKTKAFYLKIADSDYKLDYLTCFESWLSLLITKLSNWQECTCGKTILALAGLVTAWCCRLQVDVVGCRFDPDMGHTLKSWTWCSLWVLCNSE